MPELQRALPTFGEYHFRSGSDGAPVFEGYAAMFDAESQPLRDIPYNPAYVETIAPGAFRRTLASGRRITFVVDHEDSKLISATTGNLRLAEDSRGLHVESAWPSTQYANDVRALYDAGEQLAMSFTFRAAKGGEEWNAQRTRHRVTEAIVKHVTVLAAQEPAYPQTVASFRALADQLSAEPEDIESLVEALRDGRRLDEGEYNLLNRLAEVIKPEATEEPTVDRSEDAAWFASYVETAKARFDNPT